MCPCAFRLICRTFQITEPYLGIYDYDYVLLFVPMSLFDQAGGEPWR